LLSEADIQFINPFLVTLTELTVLIPSWIRLFIFAPEKLKGDAFLLELLVKIVQGRHPTILWSDGLSGRKKKVLKLSIIEIGREGPTQPCSLSSLKIVFGGASRNTTTLSDLPFGKANFLVES
jgi:hypothetical protein